MSVKYFHQPWLQMEPLLSDAEVDLYLYLYVSENPKDMDSLKQRVRRAKQDFYDQWEANRRIVR